MTFIEKLARLTEEKKKNIVSERAGLPKTAISDYLTKKTVPSGRVALSLARELRVDVAWLLDDEQDWPPVRVTRRAVVEEYAGHAA